jgi:hypothetical protein
MITFPSYSFPSSGKVGASDCRKAGLFAGVSMKMFHVKRFLVQENKTRIAIISSIVIYERDGPLESRRRSRQRWNTQHECSLYSIWLKPAKWSTGLRKAIRGEERRDRPGWSRKKGAQLIHRVALRAQLSKSWCSLITRRPLNGTRLRRR